jgi:hypothetical protein
MFVLSSRFPPILRNLLVSGAKARIGGAIRCHKFLETFLQRCLRAVRKPKFAARAGEGPQLKVCTIYNSRITRSRSPLRIRDDLGGAEHGGQEFHDDAAIHDP